MSILSRVVTVLGLAMLFSIAKPIYAESAPVYDADSMSSQMDNRDNSDSGDTNSDEGFVPDEPSAKEQSLVPQTSESMVSGGVAAAVKKMTLDQRVAKIEGEVDLLKTSNSTARIDSLQSEVQGLRGQVEQLTHQVQQMQEQQKSMFSDLDKRISQKSKAKTNDDETSSTKTNEDVIPVIPPGPKTLRKQPAKTNSNPDAPDVTLKKPVAEPNSAEEQQIYQSAYNLIKAKKYNEAVNTLQGMLQKYPSGQFASNAHYWLGELFGLMGKNDQALTEFGLVVKNYPQNPRVSDAQLKVGLIYAAQFKWPDAKTAFKKVVSQHKGTSAAHLAMEQLKQIKQAGH